MLSGRRSIRPHAAMKECQKTYPRNITKELKVSIVSKGEGNNRDGKGTAASLAGDWKCKTGWQQKTGFQERSRVRTGQKIESAARFWHEVERGEEN